MFGHFAPFGCFGGVILLAIAGTAFWILVIVFTHFLGADLPESHPS